jgi:ribonuclease VapC
VIVLDSSAVLAQILGERGAEMVDAVSGSSMISAVNFCEVFTRLLDIDPEFHENPLRTELKTYKVQPFDSEQADLAAVLRPATRHLGLSLGDRACLALAKLQGAPVLTADRNWAKLDLGIEVRLIR